MSTDWRFQVRRVYIDSQGYDDSGAYWSVGQKLWECKLAGNQDAGIGNGFSFTHYVRAVDLKTARRKITIEFPGYRYVRNVF